MMRYLVSCCRSHRNKSVANSYLVELCDRGLDAALKEFASASPPGIYSRYYLEVRIAFNLVRIASCQTEN